MRWLQQPLQDRLDRSMPTMGELCTSDTPELFRSLLSRIGDKWTLLILGQLVNGTQRFGALRRGVGGITQKVLTSTLRSLERDGFVSRRIYAAVPPRVEYSLTALGLSLVDLAAELRTWAIDHVPDVLEAQAAYDQRTLDSTGNDAP